MSLLFLFLNIIDSEYGLALVNFGFKSAHWQSVFIGVVEKQARDGIL